MAAEYSQVALPGGTKACCLNYGEAKFMLAEIPGYFTHGIQVKAGDTVLDVGANVGLFSLWVYDQYGPDVQIYAFEPVRPIFDVLDLNRVRVASTKLKVFPFGLSNECTTAEFTFFPIDPVFSSASSKRSKSWPLLKREELKRAVVAARRERGFPFLRWLPASTRPRVLGLLTDIVLRRRLKRISETATKVHCELKTLSQVIHDYGILRVDLLKIDVEGAEVDVLSGIESRDWQIIGQIVAEVESYSRNSVVVSRLLSEHGFTIIDLEQNAVQQELDIGLVFARR